MAEAEVGEEYTKTFVCSVPDCTEPEAKIPYSYGHLMNHYAVDHCGIHIYRCTLCDSKFFTIVHANAHTHEDETDFIRSVEYDATKKEEANKNYNEFVNLLTSSASVVRNSNTQTERVGKLPKKIQTEPIQMRTQATNIRRRPTDHSSLTDTPIRRELPESPASPPPHERGSIQMNNRVMTDDAMDLSNSSAESGSSSTGDTSSSNGKELKESGRRSAESPTKHLTKTIAQLTQTHPSRVPVVLNAARGLIRQTTGAEQPNRAVSPNLVPLVNAATYLFGGNNATPEANRSSSMVYSIPPPPLPVKTPIPFPPPTVSPPVDAGTTVPQTATTVAQGGTTVPQAATTVAEVADKENVEGMSPGDRARQLRRDRDAALLLSFKKEEDERQKRERERRKKEEEYEEEERKKRERERRRKMESRLRKRVQSTTLADLLPKKRKDALLSAEGDNCSSDGDRSMRSASPVTRDTVVGDTVPRNRTDSVNSSIASCDENEKRDGRPNEKSPDTDPTSPVLPPPPPPPELHQIEGGESPATDVLIAAAKSRIAAIEVSQAVATCAPPPPANTRQPGVPTSYYDQPTQMAYFYAAAVPNNDADWHNYGYAWYGTGHHGPGYYYQYGGYGYTPEQYHQMYYGPYYEQYDPYGAVHNNYHPHAAPRPQNSNFFFQPPPSSNRNRALLPAPVWNGPVLRKTNGHGAAAVESNSVSREVRECVESLVENTCQMVDLVGTTGNEVAELSNAPDVPCSEADDNKVVHQDGGPAPTMTENGNETTVHPESETTVEAERGTTVDAERGTTVTQEIGTQLNGQSSASLPIVSGTGIVSTEGPERETETDGQETSTAPFAPVGSAAAVTDPETDSNVPENGPDRMDCSTPLGTAPSALENDVQTGTDPETDSNVPESDSNRMDCSTPLGSRLQSVADPEQSLMEYANVTPANSPLPIIDGIMVDEVLNDRSAESPSNLPEPQVPLGRVGPSLRGSAQMGKGSGGNQTGTAQVGSGQSPAARANPAPSGSYRVLGVVGHGLSDFLSSDRTPRFVVRLQPTVPARTNNVSAPVTPPIANDAATNSQANVSQSSQESRRSDLAPANTEQANNSHESQEVNGGDVSLATATIEEQPAAASEQAAPSVTAQNVADEIFDSGDAPPTPMVVAESSATSLVRAPVSPAVSPASRDASRVAAGSSHVLPPPPLAPTSCANKTGLISHKKCETAATVAVPPPSGYSSAGSTPRLPEYSHPQGGVTPSDADSTRSCMGSDHRAGSVCSKNSSILVQPASSPSRSPDTTTGDMGENSAADATIDLDDADLISIDGDMENEPPTVSSTNTFGRNPPTHPPVNAAPRQPAEHDVITLSDSEDAIITISDDSDDEIPAPNQEIICERQFVHSRRCPKMRRTFRSN